MVKLIQGIALASVVLLWACGSPEQAAVDQFFRAAQTNDQTTIAAMSAAAPPGEVESWKVVEVSSRSTEDYVLPEVLDKFEASEKKRDAAAEERKKYFEDNRDSVEQIILKLRDSPDYQFRGKMGEIQAEWARMQDERTAIETEYQELKREVDHERRLASRSVARQVDIGHFSGDISVTKLLMDLTLAGNSAALPFNVTLRRYNLTEPDSDRVEQSRWVIVDIEGATEAARAAVEAAKKGPEKAAAAAPTEAKSAEPEPAATREAAYQPKELRGEARVQILAPETKVVGQDAISLVRVRNASRDWLTRFTVTEYWYDQQGNAVKSSSRVHEGRFMPGEVLEMELKTRKEANFFQNQYEFSHANGDVKAIVVKSFPTEATE